MTIALTLLAVVVVLGVSVLVHELGHFLIARLMKVDVEEFGIGFPPKLFSIKPGKTVYSLNLIPLGGFVRLEGEDEGKTATSYKNQAWWKKGLIIIAGVVVNLVWGILILTIGWSFGLPKALDDTTTAPRAIIRDARITVLAVAPESPAAQAGIAVGDTITTFQGEELSDTPRALEIIKLSSGIPLTLRICQQSTCRDATVIPRVNPPEGQGALGVALATIGVAKLPFPDSLIQATRDTGSILGQTLAALGSIGGSIREGNVGEVPLTGPIGIAVVTRDALQMGMPYVLTLAAIISINLALLNVLPIPALDGGRLVFIVIEAIRGKPVNEHVEKWIHLAGYVFLLLLFVLIFLKDAFSFRELFLSLWERIKN